jgi:hypothetical protein
MRRETAYRVFAYSAMGVSAGSGIALWSVGERLFGACGLVAASVHLLAMIDLGRSTRAGRRRRPIVIVQLRHPTDAHARGGGAPKGDAVNDG